MRADDPLLNIPKLANRPLYAWLVQFPAACFTGALLTDVVYLKSPDYLWETFSVWLLAIGCMLAAIAGVVGLAYFCRDRELRSGALAWPHALLSLFAAVLSVFNAFVHSRDGYTAVVPEGLTLSAIVVGLMIVITWMGWPRAMRAGRTGAAA